MAVAVNTVSALALEGMPLKTKVSCVTGCTSKALLSPVFPPASAALRVMAVAVAVTFIATVATPLTKPVTLPGEKGTAPPDDDDVNVTLPL